VPRLQRGQATFPGSHVESAHLHAELRRSLRQGQELARRALLSHEALAIYSPQWNNVDDIVNITKYGDGHGVVCFIGARHRVSRESQLSLHDAADLLGWSEVHLRRLIRSGRLRRSTEPGMVLWDDVRALADEAHRIDYLGGHGLLRADEPPDVAALSVPPADNFPVNRVITGNVLDVLRELPTALAQCVVTSPPYWGVRRYADDQATKWSDGTNVAFGQEKWPEEYVRHTLEILGLLRRVVQPTGVVWWNVGDTYMTRSHVRMDSSERLDALEGRRAKESWKNYPVRRYSAGHPYLKDKDLTLIPFQIALGAQRLGWYVRSIIVWSKDNTMPEPVKDRPTTSHEYILMLTQERFYKYDSEAATEEAVSDWALADNPKATRNSRSVWRFATSSRGSHVAAFPLELPRRCIRASTETGDLVFDPFSGSGTTLVAAKALGRQFLGADVSPTYVGEAIKWLEEVPGPAASLRPSADIASPASDVESSALRVAEAVRATIAS
jgi:DNA modification methylase